MCCENSTSICKKNIIHVTQKWTRNILKHKCKTWNCKSPKTGIEALVNLLFGERGYDTKE
jgi:hypothetical protein